MRRRVQRFVPAAAIAVAAVLGAAPAAAPSPALPGVDRQAATADASPMTKLRRTDAALTTALRRQVPTWSPEASAQRSRVERLVNDLLDTEEMARRSLAARWNALTPSQRREFVRTLSALAERAFVDRLSRDSGHEVRYETEDVSGEQARVLAVLTRRGDAPHPSAKLEYHMGLKNGRWMVYDVVVDGVSLIDSYRDQFSRFLRREPFDALLERMKQRLDADRERE